MLDTNSKGGSKGFASARAKHESSKCLLIFPTYTDLKIVVSGSSSKFSVWMVPQRQKIKYHGFSMYFLEKVPQACLRCLRLFSCLSKGCLKGVLRVFKVYFWYIWMVFLGLQGYLKGVSRLSQACLKSVSRVREGWLKGVSIVHDGCFKLNATWKSYWICTGCFQNSGTYVFAIFWQAKSIFRFWKWKLLNIYGTN